MSEENQIKPITNPNGWTERILMWVEPSIFKHRIKTHVILWLITLFFLGLSIYMFRVDAGFEKSIPVEHEYMKVRKKWVNDFGGGNVVVVAMLNRDPNKEIYNRKFFDKIKNVEQELQQIEGIDPVRIRSFATANTSFIEVVEGGLGGETVLRQDYAYHLDNYAKAGDKESEKKLFETVKSNVNKSGLLGLLVTEKHNGAIIKAEILQYNPKTRKEYDYQKISAALEDDIRGKFQDDDVSFHIIGFAKVVGDVAKEAEKVAGFFLIALLITIALLWWYVGLFKLAILPLFASIIAVIWEFGLLFLFGYGIDPFAVLVPFLVLAVSVSHGVQYANCWVTEIEAGYNSFDASVLTFRRLAIPGTVALFTDVAGFLTIALIQIAVIQEMSINAAFGVAAIIITNKMLMPIWLTYLKIPDVEAFQEKQRKKDAKTDPLWRWMSNIVEPIPMAITLAVSGACLAWAIHMYPKLQVGDPQAGVAELWEDHRYNQDTYTITDNFALGTDIITVVAETHDDACIDSGVMQNVDRFVWHMENKPGVVQVSALTNLAKRINSGFSEGRINAQTLPRNRFSLSQATGMIPSDSGMLNRDCNGMALDIFLKDHKASTIEYMVAAIKRYNAINRIQDPIAETLLDVRSDRRRFRVKNNNAETVIATMAAGQKEQESTSLKEAAEEQGITPKELKEIRKETKKLQEQELKNLRKAELDLTLRSKDLMAAMAGRLEVAADGNKDLKAALKLAKKGGDAEKIAAKLDSAIGDVRDSWPALSTTQDELVEQEKYDAFMVSMEEARVQWPLTDPRFFDAKEDAAKLLVFFKVLETVDEFNAESAEPDDRAEFYQEVEDEIKTFDQQTAHNVNFALATSTVGVMAATNEVVKAKELIVVAYVYVVLVIFLTLSFGSIIGMLCVVLPLSLVSAMAYAVMVVLDIGMKVATLPVTALAVGIGVDYGIYIYATIAEGLGKGQDLKEAYFQTMRKTGKAVMFIGVSLSSSVATWLWSGLKFQADMGKLLIFIFLANMFGALLLLPVLARLMVNPNKVKAGVASH